MLVFACLMLPCNWRIWGCGILLSFSFPVSTTYTCMCTHKHTYPPTHGRTCTCTCKNHPLNVIIFLFLPYQIECALLFRTDIWYNFSHLKFVLDSLSLDQRLWFCFESGTWFNGQICASVLGLLSGNGSEVTNIFSHVKDL